MLDGVGAAVCVIDTKGHVSLWNQAATALTGISSTHIRGRVFLDMLPIPSEIDGWKWEFDRILRGLAPRQFESRWRSHDGSFLSLTCFCSAIRIPPGDAPYIVCTVTDSLSLKLIKDRAAELRDISRFIHNTIAQDLVALSFNVSELQATALGLLDRCCRDVRVISCMLAPPVLPETSLEESIELYAGYVREEAGLPVAVDVDPVSGTVSPEAQALFFAAVQKWLVRGILSRSRPEISVRLRDRGQGAVLDLEMAAPALGVSISGWAIIRVRARALGGEADIAGDSTRVSAKL
jgi:PAS domain S-box-containing protein